jgi:hypothetical protein
MDERSAYSGSQPGLSGYTYGIAAIFGRAHFSRAASFSDVGMFPWQ